MVRSEMGILPTVSEPDFPSSGLGTVLCVGGFSENCSPPSVLSQECPVQGSGVVPIKGPFSWASTRDGHRAEAPKCDFVDSKLHTSRGTKPWSQPMGHYT